jgi:hypothetical protein
MRYDRGASVWGRTLATSMCHQLNPFPPSSDHLFTGKIDMSSTGRIGPV